MHSGHPLRVADPAEDIHFRKEMGITRKEFLRSLSAALGGQIYHVENNELVVADAGRRIRITLLEQPERRLGSLQLPRLVTEFTLSGYSEDEAQALMSHLDTHFQRGGG